MIDAYCVGRRVFVIADGEILGYIIELDSEPIDSTHTQITITYPEINGSDVRKTKKTFFVRNDEFIVHEACQQEDIQEVIMSRKVDIQ